MSAVHRDTRITVRPPLDLAALAGEVYPAFLGYDKAKLMLSCVFLIAFDGSHVAKDALLRVPENAIRLAVPSVLYTIQNNLLFVGIQLLSPAACTACSQSKILTSAFWSVVLLRMQITRK